MKYLNYILLLSIAGFLASCELVESPDSTENLSEGFITYPALTLNGDQFMTIDVGGTFEDPGAVATLGIEDISDQTVVTGSVDATTPGVYILDYSIQITNELEEDASVTQRRYVAVASEEGKAIDLTGTYNGDGTSVSGAWTQAATVTKTAGAWHNIDKALASGNNLGIFFAVIDGPSAALNMVVPDQNSRFGNVNSTGAGTEAKLNPDGFQWTIFIGCCGNFGPIIYSQ